MIPIKNSLEIEKMREAGRLAAQILRELGEMVNPGLNTYDIDQEAKRLMLEYGCESACYNYKVGPRRFPGFICISINDEVVHGIGSIKRELKEGDIVTLDVSIRHEGFVGDNAKTYPVGKISPEIQNLLDVTKKSLELAIDAALVCSRVGDISATVQKHVEANGYSVIREMVGHGVGRSIHEEPQIPNFGRPNVGPKLKPGMTIAIEPMVNMGKKEIRFLEDGWTVVSQDGLPSAHFEHTVLLTPNGPEILTI